MITAMGIENDAVLLVEAETGSLCCVPIVLIAVAVGSVLEIVVEGLSGSSTGREAANDDFMNPELPATTT